MINGLTSRLFLLLLISVPFFAFQSSRIPNPTPAHRYIIQLKSEKSNAFEYNLGDLLKISDQEINSKAIFPSLSIYRLDITSSITEEQIEKTLSNNREIISFNKDAEVKHRSTIPNDQGYHQQWNLDLIGAPDAWELTKGGATKNGHEIVVAIIDNGYDLEHEDLQDNIWINEGETPNNGIDDDSNGWTDDYKGVNINNGSIPRRTHGTAVAGIIGARGNNELGISGINWDVKMMLITGQGFVSDIISSYNYVRNQRELFNDTDGEKGALVVATNFSSGIDEAFAEDYPVWCAVYDELGKLGILNVAAAPNKNVDIDDVGDMPATCPSEFLVIVNNIDRNENLASDSGIGEINIDIAAPGDEAFSLSVGSAYNDFSGTSSSTPHVAGAIALMYSVNSFSLSTQVLADPQGTATNIRNVLLSSAKKLTELEGSNATSGRLDLRKAVEDMEELYETNSSSSMTIAPNPIQHNTKLSVQYFVEELGTHEVDIFDSMGRWAHSQSFIPARVGLAKVEVPINDNYLTGIYYIQVSVNGNKTTKSLFVY